MTLPEHLNHPQPFKKLNSPFSVGRGGKKYWRFFFFFPPSYLIFFLGKKTKYLPSEIPAVTIYNSLGTALPNNPNPTATSIFLFKPVSIIHGEEGCPAARSLCRAAPPCCVSALACGAGVLHLCFSRRPGETMVLLGWIRRDVTQIWTRLIVFTFLFSPSPSCFHLCKHMFGKVLRSPLDGSVSCSPVCLGWAQVVLSAGTATEQPARGSLMAVFSFLRGCFYFWSACT